MRLAMLAISAALVLSTVSANQSLAEGRKDGAPAVQPAEAGACPGNVYTGAYDKPGPDVVKALSTYDLLEPMLDSYGVQDRVLAIAIDLSKTRATLVLIADNVADVPFIAKSVPNPFEDVPTEVTLTKPYQRFLPYMLRTRGLSRALEPVYPAGCHRFDPKDTNDRADLDVVRAMAARIDLFAELKKTAREGQVDGIAIDLEGRHAKLDVTIDDAADVASVRAQVPATFEGVRTEVSVIETIDTTSFFTFGSEDSIDGPSDQESAPQNGQW